MRPWRQSELPTLLSLFAQKGEKFGGFGSFKGYNEMVIDTVQWLRHLPASVQGIFIVECAAAEANVRYSAADGMGNGGRLQSSRSSGPRDAPSFFELIYQHRCGFVPLADAAAKQLDCSFCASSVMVDS